MPELRRSLDLDGLRQAHLSDAIEPEQRARVLAAIRGEHAARRAEAATVNPRAGWRRMGFAALAFTSGALLVLLAVGLRSRLGLEAEPASSAATAAEAPLPSPSTIPLAPPRCTLGRGDAGLLADFETTDPGESFPLLSRLDSRRGHWFHQRHDERQGAVREPLRVLPSPAPSAGNQHALHVKGRAESGWGANVGIELASCYDASAYEGLEFRARGPGALFVGLQTVTSVPEYAGGRCLDRCWFTGGRFIVLDEEFRTYRVRWQDVNPPNPDQEVARELLQILFSVQSGISYDYWLDDVRLIERRR